MRLRLFITISVLLVAHLCFSQEGHCKVLKKEISGEYSGGCKKGLAHGYGIAKGVDSYEGQFKNGLPHGKGTYKWQNGEIYEGQWKKGLRHGLGIHYISPGVKETALSGKWTEDQFVKNAPLEKPYKVTYKKNIGRMNFTRIGDGNLIRLKFSRNGIIQTPASINLWGNSGTEMATPSMTGFRNVVFPFEASIKFTAPNDFNAAMISSEIKFEIIQPGSWEVIMFY